MSASDPISSVLLGAQWDGPGPGPPTQAWVEAGGHSEGLSPRPWTPQCLPGDVGGNAFTTWATLTAAD